VEEIINYINYEFLIKKGDSIMKLYYIKTLTCCLILSLIMSCLPVYLKLPPEIKVDGVYKHKHLPIHFPDSIFEFKRIRITEYSDDEKDISVGYNLRTTGKNISFTIYLTSDSLLNLYSGDTLKQVVIGNKASIEYFFEKVYPGRKIIFELKDPQQPYMSNSELHVFKVNDWIIKYRISYPEIQKSLVQQDIANIITEIESYYSM
jgi:hypothetical protein